MALHLYSLCLLYLDTAIFTFFTFFLVSEAPLRCRVVVVAKLNNCRVPSSFQDDDNLPVQLMGMESDLDGDNINVVVRVRPLNQKEVKVRDRCQGDNPIDRCQG